MATVHLRNSPFPATLPEMLFQHYKIFYFGFAQITDLFLSRLVRLEYVFAQSLFLLTRQEN